MAYLGSWKIDDYLPIPVTTHRFSSGAAYAPTSLTYSIYEDATTTGLDEDVDMTPASPFDSVTGFYLARRQLTAAAGFEKGKNYTVLIKATVDSVAAIAAHTFQIEAEVDSNAVSDKASYGLADDAITAAKFDESTAFPVKSADTGATAIARVGADGDTLETLSDEIAVIDANVDAIKVKTDALDNSAVTFVTAVNGTTITVLRGDTLSGALTDIGALTDYVSIDFTVKQNYSQTDDEAIIRIRKNASGTDDGLLRLNGAAATANLGSIAIDDLASGDITITLAASCTDDLSTGNYVYDVQMITASAVDTLTYGRLTVSSDVTRAVA